jgi:iron complex outermembrane receptor protein
MNVSKTASLRCAVRLALIAVGSAQIGIANAQEVIANAEEVPETGIEEVVVTAQRRAESIQDVPLSISAQTAEDLNRAGITDIRDLGNVVPGLAFNTQGPFASPTIRGVQSMIAQAGADSPVAIYIDGVYQPNQLSNVFDLSDIEQVEVLRGPQGTLFGRNATGGAITIHTARPDYVTSGRVSLEYGQYTGSDEDAGDMVAKAYFTAPIVDDKLAFSISGYYRSLDGFLTNDVTGGQSGEIDSYTVRAKLLYEPNDSMSFILTGISSDRDDLYSGATTALNGNGVTSVYPDGVVSNQAWHVASDFYKGSSPVYSHQDGIALNADFIFDGAGTLTSITSYTDNDGRYDVDLDTGTSAECLASFVCLDFVEYYPNRTVQQEFSFASEEFGAFSFVAGAFFYKDDHKFAADVQPAKRPNGKPDLSQPAASSFGAVTRTRAWALFGEANYSFSDTWHGIAGLRYSEEKKWGEGNFVPRFPTTGDREDSSWTPRLSIRHDLSDHTNVYFTYSKGFKSAVLSGIEQSNDVAEPETLNSYEIGFKTEGEKYRASGAVYYYDYTDLQAQFWNGTATILANAEGATMAGLEADLTYNVTEAFQFSAGASWLAEAEYDEFAAVGYSLPMSATGMVFNVVDATGERMLKTPEFTANFSASYAADTSAGTFTPSLAVFYTTEYWFDVLRRVKQDDYATLNAQVTYVPAGMDALQLSVFGRNLTNEDYFTSTLLGPTADAPVFSPPRQIGIGATYSF